MLHRLWHDALVGRDDEHDRRNATGAGEHVAYEQAVAGNVDKADPERRSVEGLHLERSEAEVDGYAAALLLGKPICVNACEGANQRRLAVIDVTGGPDDDGFGQIRHEGDSTLGAIPRRSEERRVGK